MAGCVSVFPVRAPSVPEDMLLHTSETSVPYLEPKLRDRRVSICRSIRDKLSGMKQPALTKLNSMDCASIVNTEQYLDVIILGYSVFLEVLRFEGAQAINDLMLVTPTLDAPLLHTSSLSLSDSFLCSLWLEANEKVQSVAPHWETVISRYFLVDTAVSAPWIRWPHSVFVTSFVYMNRPFCGGLSGYGVQGPIESPTLNLIPPLYELDDIELVNDGYLNMDGKECVSEVSSALSIAVCENELENSSFLFQKGHEIYRHTGSSTMKAVLTSWRTKYEGFLRETSYPYSHVLSLLWNQRPAAFSCKFHSRIFTQIREGSSLQNQHDIRFLMLASCFANDMGDLSILAPTTTNGFLSDALVGLSDGVEAALLNTSVMEAPRFGSDGDPVAAQLKTQNAAQLKTQFADYITRFVNEFPDEYESRTVSTAQKTEPTASDQIRQVPSLISESCHRMLAALRRGTATSVDDVYRVCNGRNVHRDRSRMSDLIRLFATIAEKSNGDQKPRANLPARNSTSYGTYGALFALASFGLVGSITCCPLNVSL